MSTEKDSGSSDIYGEIRSVFQTKLPELILKYQKQIDNKFVRMDSYFCFDELIESLEKIMPDTIDEHDWIDIRNYIVSNVKQFLSNCEYENIYHEGSVNKYLVDIFGQSIINIYFDWSTDDGNYSSFRMIHDTSRDYSYTRKEVKEIVRDEILQATYIDKAPQSRDDLADCNLLEEFMSDDGTSIFFDHFKNEKIKYSEWDIEHFRYNKETFLMPRFR